MKRIIFNSCFHMFPVDNFDEIKSDYLDYLSMTHCPYVSNYPKEILLIRSKIIKWIDFICLQLSLSLDTFFHCISIFDKYICTSFSIYKTVSLYELNLTLIACLSISTKQEEINCNFIKFFTENILNTPDNQMYTTKDVGIKEFEILKALKFKTLHKTAFHFNKLFMSLIKGNEYNLECFRELNENILKEYLCSTLYLTYPHWKIAMLAFKDTVIQFKLNTCQYNITYINIFFKKISSFYQYTDIIVNDKSSKSKKTPTIFHHM